MAHLTEDMMSCTIRLVAEASDGSTSVGTGFFMELVNRDGQTAVGVVTNKHVVAGAVRIRFTVSHFSPGEDWPTIPQHSEGVFDMTSVECFHHPDPNIDLCAIAAGGVFAHINSLGRVSAHGILPLDTVADKEFIDNLLPMSSVVMVGYPTGLWDEINNGAVARRGILASTPAQNYKGEPNLVLDLACFPGSSGSPIFLYNEGGYSERDGRVVLGTRFRLIGVLHSGPVMSAQGVVQIVPAPTNHGVANTSVMINLGYAVKITEMKPIFDMVEKVFDQTQATGEL